MTEARAASALLVSALIRRAQDDGGSAMVLNRGDDVAGMILVVLADRGDVTGLVERAWRYDQGFRLEPVGPKDPSEPGAISDYIARRRSIDPDIWVVELDHRDALALATTMLG
jgi:hypothetical protein